MKVAKKIGGRFVFQSKAIVEFKDGDSHDIAISPSCNPLQVLSEYIEEISALDDVDYFVRMDGTNLTNTFGQNYLIVEPINNDIIASAHFPYEMEDVTVA
jgi:hypothetical protein